MLYYTGVNDNGLVIYYWCYHRRDHRDRIPLFGCVWCVQMGKSIERSRDGKATYHLVALNRSSGEWNTSVREKKTALLSV